MLTIDEGMALMKWTIVAIVAASALLRTGLWAYHYHCVRRKNELERRRTVAL